MLLPVRDQRVALRGASLESLPDWKFQWSGSADEVQMGADGIGTVKMK